MKMGAFVDFNRPRKFSEDDFILPETPPFSWLLRKTQESANNNNDLPATDDRQLKTDACNKENENTDQRQGPTPSTDGNGGVENRSSFAGCAEEPKAMLSSQRPSRWSASPTLDEEKFLKELVGREIIK